MRERRVVVDEVDGWIDAYDVEMKRRGTSEEARPEIWLELK
jgi:hypothetical protein